MSNYDVLKERNKREKFALDLTDLLIKKYFDKTDRSAVEIDDAGEYEFKIRTSQCSLFDYNNVNLNLPIYMFEFKVINSSLRAAVDIEVSSIKYKFISESDFETWRDKYNFDLSRILYSIGEIEYKGSDCTPEWLEKIFNFLCAQFDQVHNLINIAANAFKKYYKDMKIKTISFKETKNDA